MELNEPQKKMKTKKMIFTNLKKNGISESLQTFLKPFNENWIKYRSVFEESVFFEFYNFLG